ncbi:hypothetical protein [Deinococcus sp. Marseille-Q6407]|uniref:hypothetical protein n=1 Tax=Deinococcus sp. Marseille-Q6407 TaxID=2969223 RepID=UPI0021C1A2DA|nr:hypothetical protein [Deinococcus sp. Marseille-Q6407]
MPQEQEPSVPAPGPDLLWQISAVLLLAAGLGLLSPVLGGPMPPVEAVAALLGLRLALQAWRAVRLGQAREQLPSLALTVVLLVLLL